MPLGCIPWANGHSRFGESLLLSTSNTLTCSSTCILPSAIQGEAGAASATGEKNTPARSVQNSTRPTHDVRSIKIPSRKKYAFVDSVPGSAKSPAALRRYSGQASPAGRSHGRSLGVYSEEPHLLWSQTFEGQ